MQLIVMYDIPSNRLRLKIIDACMDFGLDRLQFSVFEGELSAKHQADLTAQLRRLMDGQDGEVLVVGIAADDWRRRARIGDAPAQSPATAGSPEVRRDNDPF